MFSSVNQLVQSLPLSEDQKLEYQKKLYATLIGFMLEKLEDQDVALAKDFANACISDDDKQLDAFLEQNNDNQALQKALADAFLELSQDLESSINNARN